MTNPKPSGELIVQYALPDMPQQVDAFLNKVESCARVTNEPPAYFIEPYQGALEQITGRRHHVVFGRRGSGKSSLLRKAQESIEARGDFCAFLDVEPWKQLELADQVIVAISEVLRQLASTKSPSWTDLSQATKDTVKKELEVLDKLLDETDESIVEMRETQVLSDAERSALSGGIVLPFFKSRGDIASAQSKVGEVAKVQILKSNKMTKLLRRNAQVVEPLLRTIYRETKRPYFVIFDDFYHLKTETQPFFINIFFGLFKQSNFFLKIGSVETRTLCRWQTGSQMFGIEMPNDAHEINLDRALKQFVLTRGFLDSIVTSLAGDAGFKRDDLLTDGAFNRLVQASGGVPRDLLNLLLRTVRDARERWARDSQVAAETGQKFAGSPRVTADDTWRSAARLDVEKRQEFRQDIDAQDQEYFLLKLEDIKAFCYRNGDSRMLVPTAGSAAVLSEFRVLWDAKFVHILDDSIRFQGRDYVGYMLDIGTHAADRERRNIVKELGDPAAFEGLTKVGLIFQPA